MNWVIAQEYFVLGNKIWVQTKLNLKPKIIVKIIVVGIGTHEKRLYRDEYRKIGLTTPLLYLTSKCAFNLIRWAKAQTNRVLA